VARFWSKVDIPEGDFVCWNWRAGKTAKGYGRFKHRGYMRRAHRIAWEIVHGEALGDRVARHTCDNPSCCNPRHIVPGTVQDNVDDMMSRGRHVPHLVGTMAGENNPNSKLTENDVAAVRLAIGMGDTDELIANRHGVSAGAIEAIRRGRSWAPLGSTNQRENPLSDRDDQQASESIIEYGDPGRT
jgi:hypothetical protein